MELKADIRRFKLLGTTVDGTNPALPDMYEIPQKMRYLPYQLVSRICSINSKRCIFLRLPLDMAAHSTAANIETMQSKALEDPPEDRRPNGTHRLFSGHRSKNRPIWGRPERPLKTEVDEEIMTNNFEKCDCD